MKKSISFIIVLLFLFNTINVINAQETEEPLIITEIIAEEVLIEKQKDLTDFITVDEGVSDIILPYNKGEFDQVIAFYVKKDSCYVMVDKQKDFSTHTGVGPSTFVIPNVGENNQVIGVIPLPNTGIYTNTYVIGVALLIVSLILYKKAKYIKIYLIILLLIAGVGLNSNPIIAEEIKNEVTIKREIKQNDECFKLVGFIKNDSSLISPPPPPPPPAPPFIPDISDEI